MISIKNLSASVENKNILNGLSLDIPVGKTHALMGPNGSGKSTLAQAIIGNPFYSVHGGSIHWKGKDITNLAPHERSKLGIFLSFQQPPAIPGLTVFSLLKEIQHAHKGAVALESFKNQIEHYCDLLNMDRSFLQRSCNDGFSGGEKKRFELLQLLVVQPKLVILDEIDSGLDIDALKLVAKVINKMREHDPEIMVLIITHYKRILDHVTPDLIHVLVNGVIAQTSDVSLMDQLELKGYDGYIKSQQL